MEGEEISKEGSNDDAPMDKGGDSENDESCVQIGDDNDNVDGEVQIYGYDADNIADGPHVDNDDGAKKNYNG